jgi:hypothetical protein
MGNNATTYSSISNLQELRLQKETLRRKVEMQEELLSSGSGKIKSGVKAVSALSGLFSGASRYTAVLSLAWTAYKLYRRYRK